MLNLINTLEPFFRDCYRRINVREYARLSNRSPPTASKILFNLKKEDILKSESDRGFIYYYANKDSDIFVDYSRIYWKTVLKKSGLITHLDDTFLNPVIILFGSLAKGEVKENSDIDLAVFAPSKKTVNLSSYEKKLGKVIQIFVFKNKNEPNDDLLNSILNGYKISGDW